MLNLNFNLPKTKWDSAEDSTINKSMNLITDNFEYALNNANLSKPTAVFHAKSIEILLRGRCPRGLMVHQLWHRSCLENN